MITWLTEGVIVLHHMGFHFDPRRVSCPFLFFLDLFCFPLRVLCENKTSLKTADHAQKFKNNGTIFIIMTSSFMTMTNNWTVSSYYWIHLRFFEISLCNLTIIFLRIQTIKVALQFFISTLRILWGQLILFWFQLFAKTIEENKQRSSRTICLHDTVLGSTGTDRDHIWPGRTK